MSIRQQSSVPSPGTEADIGWKAENERVGLSTISVGDLIRKRSGKKFPSGEYLETVVRIGPSQYTGNPSVFFADGKGVEIHCVKLARKILK
jgi:hypothetical protein